MNGIPWLTLLTLLPAVGALTIGLSARADEKRARLLAIGFSAASVVLVAGLWLGFEPAPGGAAVSPVQYEELHSWIPTLNISYHLGVDGLGMVMIGLAALVFPMALITSAPAKVGAARYYALMLSMQFGLFGTFTALNFFHWFLFWELSLIPAFFLVRFWGGAQRQRASVQFFVMTMVGSIAMLVGFVALFLVTGELDFLALAELGGSGELREAMGARFGTAAPSVGTMMFAAVLLGFAVKVPLVPFHTWLPSTYATAPTSVSMVLTGVMSKMGVYGLLRILLPIFPEAMRAWSTPLLWLAVATILFGAGAALVQKDLKRVLAYSSINHLGYCWLGVFAVAAGTSLAGEGADGGAGGLAFERASALNGVMVQVFSHGITAAALFGFVGVLERRRQGARRIDDFGGLRSVTPVFCGLMGLALFSSIGLPGLNGFVGEFLIFKGAFALASWFAVFAVPGLLITAVFLLNVFQKLFYGPVSGKSGGMPDLSGRDLAVFVPASVLMVVVGVFPQLLIATTAPAASRLVDLLSRYN